MITRILKELKCLLSKKVFSKYIKNTYSKTAKGDMEGEVYEKNL